MTYERQSMIAYDDVKEHVLEFELLCHNLWISQDIHRLVGWVDLYN